MCSTLHCCSLDLLPGVEAALRSQLVDKLKPLGIALVAGFLAYAAVVALILAASGDDRDSANLSAAVVAWGVVSVLVYRRVKRQD